MKSGMSYIKDTNDFLLKLQNVKKVPDNAILVTVNVGGLYPSIPHNEGLEVLQKQLDNFYEKSIPTEDLVKMVEFVLKNNYFEFDSNGETPNIWNSYWHEIRSTICVYI